MTFHIPSNYQLAYIFTKALGLPAFMNLLKRLGVLNVFSASIKYPEPLQDSLAAPTSEAAVVLRGTVKKKEEIKRDYMMLYWKIS